MGVLLGPSLVPGNRVNELLNGEQIFPAMLKAIGSAEQTITFETYIYWSGSIGKAFVDALCERAKAALKCMFYWTGWAAIGSTRRISVTWNAQASRCGAITNPIGTTSAV